MSCLCGEEAQPNAGARRVAAGSLAEGARECVGPPRTPPMAAPFLGAHHVEGPGGGSTRTDRRDPGCERRVSPSAPTQPHEI
jgi:hypothetical protein